MSAGSGKTIDTAKWGHMEVSEFAYYLSFGLFVFVYNLNKANFTEFLFINAGSIYDVGRITCAVILIGKLLMQRYRTSQLLGIAGVGIVITATLYVTRDWNLALLTLFILAGQGITPKRLVLIALPIQLVMISLTVLFASDGTIESIYVYRNIDGVLRLRSSYGYVHPNSFGQTVLSISCSFAFLRFGKFSPLDLAAHLTGMTVCYVFADSRTSMACIALVLCLALFAAILVKLDCLPLFSTIACGVAIATVALSVYAMLNYDPSIQWLADLNKAISARLSLANAYYLSYPIKLLGYPVRSLIMPITSSSVQYGPDNAYVRLLIQDGLLTALIFLALYVTTFLKFVKARRADACLFGMLVFSVAAVMESYALSFAANYYLIGMTVAVYGWGCYDHDTKYASGESGGGC